MERKSLYTFIVFFACIIFLGFVAYGVFQNESDSHSGRMDAVVAKKYAALCGKNVTVEEVFEEDDLLTAEHVYGIIVKASQDEKTGLAKKLYERVQLKVEPSEDPDGDEEDSSNGEEAENVKKVVAFDYNPQVFASTVVKMSDDVETLKAALFLEKEIGLRSFALKAALEQNKKDLFAAMLEAEKTEDGKTVKLVDVTTVFKVVEEEPQVEELSSDEEEEEEDTEEEAEKEDEIKSKDVTIFDLVVASRPKDRKEYMEVLMSCPTIEVHIKNPTAFAEAVAEDGLSYLKLMLEGVPTEDDETPRGSITVSDVQLSAIFSYLVAVATKQDERSDERTALLKAIRYVYEQRKNSLAMPKDLKNKAQTCNDLVPYVNDVSLSDGTNPTAVAVGLTAAAVMIAAGLYAYLNPQQ